MKCLCFRPNKVAPTKEVEVPHVSATRKLSALSEGDSTFPEGLNIEQRSAARPDAPVYGSAFAARGSGEVAADGVAGETAAEAQEVRSVYLYPIQFFSGGWGGVGETRRDYLPACLYVSVCVSACV